MAAVTICSDFGAQENEVCHRFPLLMRVKEESAKVSLKLNIQKTKVMAFRPITSWQTYGESIETVKDFIFLGSKITAGGD